MLGFAIIAKQSLPELFPAKVVNGTNARFPRMTAMNANRSESARADSVAMKRPVLEMLDVSKRFGATQALDGVSLALYPGEIHALLGENGAGKSTLIKIMTGIQHPDSGQMMIDGIDYLPKTSQDAQRHGVAAMYQEPMIFPDLTVAENIYIGHHDRGRIVRRGKSEDEAQALLDLLGVPLDAGLTARGLTLAEQQTVEIAKAISLQTRVLIMDEPTASLSAHEVGQLFRIISSLREQGVAILFISHRMEEVFEIADRVTILRDGQWISTRLRDELTVSDAIRDMVGRPLVEVFHREHQSPGPLRLAVSDLGREGVFSGVTFDLHEGEVLGFAGLVGAGRTDVALALFGINPSTSGTITLDGSVVQITSPQQAMALGIAYSTEDRRKFGLVMPFSITSNISLPSLPRYLSPLGLVQRNEERESAEAFRRRLQIRAPSVESQTSSLSGGNQQKVVISKWLDTRPNVLILDEPTRGIDVGAKAEVHQLIDDLARDGMAILLISSDLPEVLAMSDRVLVMREGRQMAIFDHREASQEVILTAAMGQSEQEILESAGIDGSDVSDILDEFDRALSETSAER